MNRVILDILQTGKTILASGEAIEVAGYNVNSYYLVDEPPFLQAEILDDGEKPILAQGSGHIKLVALAWNVHLRYGHVTPCKANIVGLDENSL